MRRVCTDRVGVLKAFPGSVGRILALLAVVALAPLLLVQAGIYWRWTRVRSDREYQANQEVAQAVAPTFEAFIRDVDHQNFALGHAAVELGRHEDAARRITHLLNDALGRYHAVRSFNWISPEGIVLASTLTEAPGVTVRDRPYFQAIQSGRSWVVTNVTPGRVTGSQTVLVARRIDAAAGQWAGIMMAALEPAELGAGALSIQRPAGGQLVIFDSAAHVAYSTLPDLPAGSPWPSDEALLAGALTGQAGQGVLIRPDRSRHLAAAVPMTLEGGTFAGAPWVAMAFRSRQEALGDIYHGLQVVVAANLAVVLASLLVARFLSRTLTRPLGRLREHAHALGRGELERRAQIRSVRELDELAESLNGMAQSLAEARARQEQARAALESANERLGQEVIRRQQTAEELERLAADLRRSNEDLERFAYVSSHDLQEPLRAITGYVQLLERRFKGQLGEDADRYIAFTVDGAQRMQQLIQDLLSYSRVGSRGSPFGPVDMEEVLARVRQALQYAIAESGATITHDPLPSVRADATQMGQLLQNLLSNAIKFRRDQPPATHVSACPDGPTWIFTVRDNGIGIDAKYWDRIFIIFQRLHARRLYKGTGVGLAICKRIVERHGGRIWVDSTLGQGSTFYFTIGARTSDEPEQQQASRNTAG